MIYVAKMTTNYPDFHGTGYYNFLMDSDREALDEKVEENSHDFRLEKVVTTRFATLENLIAKFPTKKELNEALFL